MNILHVTNALSEGGVESLLYDLSSKAIDEGHDVSILVLNKKLVALKAKFEKVGVKIYVGKYSNLYNPLNVFVIRKYMINFQIIHVHLFPTQLFAALAYCFFQKGERPLLVTTEHNTYNNRRRYAYLKYLDRFFYRKYEKIVCISKQTEINLINWLGNSWLDKTQVIINGIDLDKFANAKNLLPQYVSVSSNMVCLAMVGRFEKPKDQLTVIKALKYLPDNIHLILIGSGNDLINCKSYSKKEGVLERTHFLGYRENVQSLLKGCKIGVLSTGWDGFGLASVEYMASGIPVIASDVDGLRDVVGRQDLLFKVGDFEELSEKILALLDDEYLYNEMQTYCLSVAVNFSIDVTYSQYSSLYNSILLR